MQEGEWLRKLRKKHSKVAAIYALPLEEILRNAGSRDFEDKFNPLESRETMVYIRTGIKDNIFSVADFRATAEDLNLLEKKQRPWR
jgi:hypothetical protein